MAYLTQTQSGQPVLILKEGTSRSRGKEAQRNHVEQRETVTYVPTSASGVYPQIVHNRRLKAVFPLDPN